MTQPFWKPKPREPWDDWRTYSMLLPILCGALGACIFFALGLAFAEIVNIRPEVRKPMILVAAFGVAIGSTFGSVGSGIEIFRKSHKGQAKVWDWVSLTISTVTTIAGMVIGVATLLGGTTNWSQEAVIWGSAVVCGFSALDAAGDMIELGGLFGSFEDRFETWLLEREEWRRANGLAAAQDGPEVESRIAALEQRWSWPTAQKADFEFVLAGMNGNKDHSAADLTRERLAEELAKNQLNLPSTATVDRWLGMAKEG
jgi:hypothetical protein